MAANSGKSQTTKRKQSSSGTARKQVNRAEEAAKRRKLAKAKEKQKKELTLLIAAVPCILMVIFNIFIHGVSIADPVGTVLSKAFFAVFGLEAYVMPFFIYGMIVYATLAKKQGVAKIKIGFASLGMLFISAIIHMITAASKSELLKIDFDGLGYVKDCFENRFGGGFFGGGLAELMVKLMGNVAPYFILVVLIIVCICLIVENTPVGIFKKIQHFFMGNGSREDKPKRTVKDDWKEYGEEYQKKQERREREYEAQEAALRRKKVRGVSMDTTLGEDNGNSEDIHEVYKTSTLGSKRKKTGLETAQDTDLFHDDYPTTDAIETEDLGNRIEPKKTPNSHYEFERVDQVTSGPAAHPDYTMEETQRYFDEQSNSEDITDEEIEEIIPASPKRVEKDYLKPGNTWNGESDASLDAVDEWAETTQPTFEPDEPRTAKEYETDVPVYHDPEPRKSISDVPEPVEEQFVAVPQKPAAPKRKKRMSYRFPGVELLHRSGSQSSGSQNGEELEQTKIKLQKTLSTFGVQATVKDYTCGPAVTRYELDLAPGVKVSKIISLSDDIKLALAATDIRIEAPIPGTSLVGIEVPNKSTSGVLLGDLIATNTFRGNKSKLACAVGKDISGQLIVADIAKMPHVLIAGSTGSGKSVCINSIVMSILYHAHPDDVKLIMVDPKVVELSVYNGIPHLMTPVVTDPKKAAGALNWAVAEMTDRYQKFAQIGVRDRVGYNEKVDQLGPDIPEDQRPEKMPQIVIIIDELADLMMVASKDVEAAIVRLAQLARAAGIHLVIATQRPSVDVIKVGS